jgi:hypothetical protein
MGTGVFINNLWTEWRKRDGLSPTNTTIIIIESTQTPSVISSIGTAALLHRTPVTDFHGVDGFKDTIKTAYQRSNA